MTGFEDLTLSFAQRGDPSWISNVHFGATALPTASVPEPGSLALLGLGLLGLGWARCR